MLLKCYYVFVHFHFMLHFINYFFSLYTARDCNLPSMISPNNSLDSSVKSSITFEFPKTLVKESVEYQTLLKNVKEGYRTNKKDPFPLLWATT